MFKKLLILTFAALLGITTTYAAPSKATTPEPPPSPQEPQQQHTVENMQLLNPHIITIERFESLLRRAGELFRPAAAASYQLMRSEPAAAVQITQQVAASTPYQHMQPPTEEPYNFYLPLFQYEDVKLDAKSRHLENIVPPPAPSSEQDQIDYYSAKPKKLPKKFVGTAKQVNINWLNALEKGTFVDHTNDASSEREVPTAVYMVNDEGNRINFDDSFFGVDMQVKIPADNEPHKDVKNNGGDEQQAQQQEGFLNQGEEMDEDDLLAAAAVQVPQINYDRVPVKA